MNMPKEIECKLAIDTSEAEEKLLAMDKLANEVLAKIEKIKSAKLEEQ